MGVNCEVNRRSFICGGVSAAAFLGGCRFLKGGADTSAVRAELQRGIDERVISGAVFATTGGVGPEAIGELASGVAMRPDSLFDLASVTKTFTALSCALLYADGRLDVDAPFTEYLTDHVLARENCRITLRDLATHTGGFDNETSKEGCKGADFLPKILSKRPVRARGTGFEYACYDMVVLGLVVSRVSGRPLDAFCRERIFKPLGMTRTLWGPLQDDGNVVEMLAAPAHGQISDFLARGASFPVGNAGAFSTADDMLLFVDDLLARRTFPKASYDLLFTPSYRNADGICRSFGFDMSPKTRPFGLSERTVFHSGWTGQTICADPESGFGGVLLTGRCGDWGMAFESRRRVLGMLCML